MVVPDAVVVVPDDEVVVVPDAVVVVPDDEVARQVGLVIVLESRVTAPFLASSRPLTVALVSAVIDVRAKTVPSSDELVPKVAELPTCQ